MKYCEFSVDLLTDFLVNLNERNKENISNSSKCRGHVVDKKLTECVLLITEGLGLDPLAGYHAVALLQRFMVKHLTDFFTTPTPEGSAADQLRRDEDAVFDELSGRFPLIVFSCVQLASKMSLHSNLIDNNTAVQFLHSAGFAVTKQTVMESELMVLRELEFSLNTPNPVVYVEVLLEVLGHNEASIPTEHLRQLCHHVLQFVCLQRTAIYDSLLVATTKCLSPSREQREKFATVTEDCMLLGVGVVAVSSFILYVSRWEQVVKGLSNITGISKRSISDFSLVTLMHMVGTSSPGTSAP
ncbi:cyclin N-terminal domain-containing protein 1 [Aulostomus maculatus]